MVQAGSDGLNLRTAFTNLKTAERVRFMEVGPAELGVVSLEWRRKSLGEKD